MANKRLPAATALTWINSMAAHVAAQEAGAAAVLATPATPAASVAQAGQAEQVAAAVEVVRVTGSRIARRDADRAGPMRTMTKEGIRFAAPTSLGDLLQAMPSVGVSLNSNFSVNATRALMDLPGGELGLAAGHPLTAHPVLMPRLLRGQSRLEHEYAFVTSALFAPSRLAAEFLAQTRRYFDGEDGKPAGDAAY